MGYDIYRVPPKYSNPVGFVFKFYKILRISSPDILHLHQNYSSWLAVLLGKIKGCKIIVHGHQFYFRETFYQRVHNKLSSLIIDRADVKLACTLESFKWLWRENPGVNGIIYNAFDFLDFKFSNKVRECIREELGVKSDVKLIGVIGRLSKQKNYPFIFEIIKNLPSDKFKFIIIGEGEAESELKKSADLLRLNSIIWIEPNDRISDFMCSMDLLLMPSLWEGLGIVALEGQVNGLPVFISEHLPKDLDLSPLLRRIPVFESGSIDLWLKEIYALQINSSRESMINQLRFSHYNINNSWTTLFKVYDDIYKTSN